MTPSRALRLLALAACALTVAAPALAQKTQGEIELQQAIQAQRDRQSQAASTQAMHDEADALRARAAGDAAASRQQQAASRQQEIDAPARAAAARSAQQAERNAAAAEEERYQAGQRRAMDALRLRDYKEQAWKYARDAYERHDFAAAVTALDHVDAIDPGGQILYLDRALSKAHLGLYAEAQADIALAEKDSPKSAYIVGARAEVLEMLGDTKSAAAAFDTAVAAEPRGYQILNARGVFRIRQKDYAGAVDDLTRAVAATYAPDNANALAALKVAKAALAGRPPEPDTPLYDADPPVNPCDRAAALPTDDTRPRGWSGVPDERLDLAVAIPACQAQVAAAPADLRARLNLARVLIEAKRCDEAKPNLDAALAGNVGAAWFMDAGLSAGKCPALAPADPMAAVMKAYGLKNGTAADYLYHTFDDAKTTAARSKNDAAFSVAYKAADPYANAMVDAFGKLAAQGDRLGIIKMAEFAHDGLFNSNWVPKIMACKVRSYPSCKDY